ncbi:hypothetical protein [Hoeflea alexandrii]|uniref:Uncharacterized protein n=1 Tax=Hoeflea alexandrii TaxID=288436 RepID=A0ABT1CKP2_9HYPH|nr:hypothetical protein [Hoeflea alexandrii]MCO6406773.1 hypothetical protein [Hoeflea alexandrii]MCY0154752.1 hypothetical protein [Hoeflea alexandrii]
MNINNTTTPAYGAVWTEKELFQHFLTMTLKDYDAFGNVQYEYEPDILLGCPGGFETLENLFDQIVDDFNEDDEPETRLENMIDDLEGYISILKKLHAAFDVLKRDRIIMPPEPEETVDNATWHEWERAANEAENNPRFRPIVTETTLSGEAA